MTLEEVRAIREKQSLETINMTTEQLHAYHAKGANKMQKLIEEIRKQKNYSLKIKKEGA